jgi:hypothetical protein
MAIWDADRNSTFDESVTSSGPAGGADFKEKSVLSAQVCLAKSKEDHDVKCRPEKQS